MIKHLSKISGLAAFAVLAASASAEVKLNENFSVDGYAIGSGVITEGTAAQNHQLVNSSRLYDSFKVAANGTFESFTSKVSVYGLKSDVNGTASDVGLLDAYVTYTTGNFAITGGKFLSALGYESFDSPSNDFISYSSATYSAPYATGAKIEYTEAKQYTVGLAVRDSQFDSTNGNAANVPAKSFFEGDGSFSNDVGYEAYFLYTGIEKLKVFVGQGYQQVNFQDGSDDRSFNTSNAWVSYDLTNKLTLVAEYGSIEDTVDYSWNVIASYAFTADFSGAVRVTGSEGVQGTNDTFGYGVASTYVLHKNFSLKAEVTKTENNTQVTANGSDSDVFSYALQGVLRF
jgi:hypothetical protein